MTSTVSTASAARPRTASPFGSLLRAHRERRRLSQASLAEHAEVSARHVSFLETGKASPSREMVLVLGSALELTLRDRNALLHAAGFAPAYRESPVESPELGRAVELLLAHHEPFPAMVYDPLWNLVRANDAALGLFALLVSDVPEAAGLLGNAMRLLFHPKGVRPYLENWDEIARYLLDQFRRELHAAPRDGAEALLREIEAWAGPLPHVSFPETALLEVRLRKGDLALRFFTTMTTLGTPLDVTAQELRIETYFPADAATRAYFEGTRRG